MVDSQNRNKESSPQYSKQRKNERKASEKNLLDLRQRARPKRVVLRGKCVRNTEFSDNMPRVVTEVETVSQFQNYDHKELIYNNNHEQIDLPVDGVHSST